MPTASYPACLTMAAVTELSTPPDMATTTRAPAGRLRGSMAVMAADYRRNRCVRNRTGFRRMSQRPFCRRHAIVSRPPRAAPMAERRSARPGTSDYGHVDRGLAAPAVRQLSLLVRRLADGPRRRPLRTGYDADAAHLPRPVRLQCVPVPHCWNRAVRYRRLGPHIDPDLYRRRFHARARLLARRR